MHPNNFTLEQIKAALTAAGQPASDEVVLALCRLIDSAGGVDEVRAAVEMLNEVPRAA